MPKPNVFITVDTEHSIGGAFADPTLKPVGNDRRIYGRIGGQEYGIGLIMDIADRYGLKVTFFVEVFNKYFFGEGETREVVETILRRGHDVQLHLHPNYLNFTLDNPREVRFSDLIGEYPLAQQIKILGEARQLLEKYGAPQVTAFRAGCFGANVDTLEALAKNGFLIDSSYNGAFLGGPCLMPDWGINDLMMRDGIYEFPVTNFREATGLRAARRMPLDINGVSFEEMRHVMQACRADGPRHLTVILHSFSFVRAYDVQYRKMRPRTHVIRRFEKLCRFLAENTKDFRVRTFGGIKSHELQAMAHDRDDQLPQVPGYLSLLRFGGQLWDRVA